MEITLIVSLTVLVISIIFSFLAGLITKNYSHTDRLWSVLPPLYALIWGFKFYSNPRFAIAALLITAWGIRLTLNFASRGGYRFSWEKGFTGEDYRWKILRQRINNTCLFEIFNLVFISGFQLVLIFLFTLPLYYTGLKSTPLSSFDYMLFGAHIVFLLLETAADNQQNSFYKKKNLNENQNNPRYCLGFNTFGLWRLSRHPNYVFEIGQWIIVWLYTCSAYERIHFSGAGVLILILLFIGSTVMTEGIASEKYPDYKTWKRLCSPWIPGYKTLFKHKQRDKFLGYHENPDK